MISLMTGAAFARDSAKRRHKATRNGRGSPGISWIGARGGGAERENNNHLAPKRIAKCHIIATKGSFATAGHGVQVICRRRQRCGMPGAAESVIVTGTNPPLAAPTVAVPAPLHDAPNVFVAIVVHPPRAFAACTL